jgi:hypothetical protein
LTAKEREWLNGVDKFLEEETGYIDIQATKPQTIGYALHDSPSTIFSAPAQEAPSVINYSHS